MIRVKRGNLYFRQTSIGMWFYHRYDQKIPLAIKVFNNLENAIKDSEKAKTMSDNRYLIKALRNYRKVTYGQFDQESNWIVQETQDAATEIERLNKIIKELKDKIFLLERTK